MLLTIITGIELVVLTVTAIALRKKFIQKQYAVVIAGVLGLLLAWQTLDPMARSFAVKHDDSCLSKPSVSYRNDDFFFSVCHPKAWELITEIPDPAIKLQVSSGQGAEYLDMQVIVNYKPQLEEIATYEFVSAQTGEERVESMNAATGMNNFRLRNYQITSLSNSPAYLLEVDYNYFLPSSQTPFVALKFLTLMNGYEFQLVFRVHASYYEYVESDLYEIADSFLIQDSLRNR